MIFIDKMKNLKIYRTPMFLPTLEKDKKRSSVILLMTPNYDSSKKLIDSPLFINRRRFMSYYIKRDVSYYINSKNADEPLDESVDIINTEDLKFIPESVINTGDKLIFFNEDANDSQLYRMIYKNRMKTRKDVIALYDKVKIDIPEIKYTFPDIKKYMNKNIYEDLYFYNKLFFENNTWILSKGLNLYLKFMERLLNDPELKENGYKKKTIFIPVTDWCKDNNDWNFKKSLNPVSIIYQLLIAGNIRAIKSVFGDSNIIFSSSNKYFKLNFSEIEDKEISKIAVKFKLFVIKFINNEEFDLDDIDTTPEETESSDVIKANIIDKIELAKGIDITSAVANAPLKRLKQNNLNNTTSQKPKDKKNLEKEDIEDKENISKGTLNKQDQESKLDDTINKLADIIDQVANTATSEDDAWESLDDEQIKAMILDLDSMSDDKPDISIARAERMTELEKKLMQTEIKGKTIKDLLEPENKSEQKPMEVDISTTNDEWKEMKFVNFDKNYDLDRDIVRIFKFFSTTSRPISIRNISVEDNSTSEDRVELYTVEMEDYRGVRYTIKLDIPIMVDNRFLLRGSNKSIQTQFFNMPIIKTEEDTCQIISNYMKIFVRKFGSGVGKATSQSAKFIKACNKYNGRLIKIETGNNIKICNKYKLPIDYIDIASSISKIETEDFIIYFNQDIIRSLYSVEDSKGVPYLYDKKSKELIYYTNNNSELFVSNMMKLSFENEDKYGNKYSQFTDLYDLSTSPTICAYSRCSIMNSQIPLVVICAYHEGLRKTLDKASIRYNIKSTLSKEDRHNPSLDWIKFKDGYLIYECNYESSLLMNGLKTCPVSSFEISNIDNKNMYLEFLDNFGGRIKADGLDNFYDLMIDPMTEDSLKFYKLPTDYVSVLLYANALLVDNKFIKHTDTSSRRLRRYILIAVYTYKVLSDAYALYSNQVKHTRSAEFSVKQSAVIDRFLTDTITSDDSCINALRDVETTNSITTKGPSGMNSDRAYGLDKRTYDESMLNVLGMSTGFAGNVGITRQSTIDANVDENGYVISINGNTDKMNTTSTLTITEALTPFGTTHDDPMRTAMTFIQTAKHAVRTEDSDPLLVTNGSDEALAYITTDKFAFKAKKNGKIVELNDSYIMVEYDDGTKDFINLTEKIEKNSDGGYYVPLKLSAYEGLKVGSIIKENQILAYDKYSFSNSVGESDNIAYNIGKLAKVAIINTDEGFEDSGVITENMAEKLATRIDLQFSKTLDKNTNLIYMAKVGDKVECGDNLLIWQAPFDDEEANSLMKTLAGEDVSELGKRTLKSEVTGVIKAIKIFRTVELDDLSESLRKVVDDYEKPLRVLKKKLEDNNLDTSQVPAHYILPPTGKLKKAQNAIIIEYYVEYKDVVGVGDKVVYFSANKAVEKNIIPKGKEPYTDFRPNEPIDAFISEVSIDKRMVCSSLIIGSLQKLMIELDRSVKDIMGIPYDDSTV